jgi:beta-lactam-binding protein with PASTA domain
MRRRGLLALVVLVAAPAASAEDPSAVPPPVAAAAPETVRVPDVRKLTAPAAAELLAAHGLGVARVFDVRFETAYALGTVVQQRPAPGASAPYASGVELRVMAEVSGSAVGRPPDPAWPRAAPRPAPPPPVPPVTAPPGSSPPVAPTGPLPADPAPPPAPPARTPVLPPALPLTGSPDAPAVAERAKPGIVPDVKGLDLVDAEQRVREADLVLYVERVAGHPVGRVLSQVPDAGAARASGSVVTVTVTAGGDYEGARPPPPAVEVRRVTVPDLLDRTALQAERILDGVGLAMRQETAAKGPAGCVVDQKPGYGEVLDKGAVVSVWVTPPPAKPPSPFPSSAAPPPAPSAGPGAPAPGSAPTPATPTPPTPGAAPLGAAPATVAPAEGTVLPKARTVPVGFTWTAVSGADAYVLEVEERSGAAWLANVRKPVRTTAATVDVERLAPTAGDLRWRVRALAGGAEGPPSPWVLLK